MVFAGQALQANAGRKTVLDGLSPWVGIARPIDSTEVAERLAVVTFAPRVGNVAIRIIV